MQVYKLFKGAYCETIRFKPIWKSMFTFWYRKITFWFLGKKLSLGWWWRILNWSREIVVSDYWVCIISLLLKDHLIHYSGFNCLLPLQMRSETGSRLCVCLLVCYNIPAIYLPYCMHQYGKNRLHVITLLMGGRDLSQNMSQDGILIYYHKTWANSKVQNQPVQLSCTGWSWTLLF